MPTLHAFQRRRRRPPGGLPASLPARPGAERGPLPESGLTVRGACDAGLSVAWAEAYLVQQPGLRAPRAARKALAASPTTAGAAELQLHAPPGAPGRPCAPPP